MKAESFVLGLAGIFFGLIVGWVIGSQQAPAGRVSSSSAQAPRSSAGAAAEGEDRGTSRTTLDVTRIRQLQALAEREPTNASVRVELGNAYFDAERYDEASRWYEAALRQNPRDVNVSTDLGICYYYLNQPDRALKQFEASLAIDPRHPKTMLNVGVVRAYGKQDLEGAVAAWQKVIELVPRSPEAEQAKHALDTLQSTHPNLASSRRGGPGS